ncbi:MAG: AAC(3) family N-acetyltransferase [Chloroflexi bacterium]|nr:AAC(3) family N-acetyltransferase [Chloroflexota bacterium]MCI0578520.1 AAC(3) family N-acetyltransferase [Chloroflexota bacterium]MCI0647190.1 AAC(3) family N-acetyltransferase [Chloroflexota bacterium]MCI0727219.1 AAC(3) family N-acetyltransferase [Chloroflexota bacterium]
MSEQATIENAPRPRTRQSLAADLRRLGLAPGMAVLVHSSLSSLGWVTGGPVAVIQALQDVLTPQGTLVMPAHSSDYSEPSYWRHPPVPEAWFQVIRDAMPAFDPRLTPTRGLGRIAELFRTWPDVYRSYHPRDSFAAWGRHAGAVTAGHSLDYGLGEQSPLARVYDLDGRVLLLGVGYDRNTSFHLAEYRAPGVEPFIEAGPVLQDGRRVWQTFQDIVTDSDIFPDIGAEFEATGRVTVGQVGSAECRFFSLPAAVDFAQAWLTNYRQEES